MELSAAVSHATQQLRGLLVERFGDRLLRLVLFGSQARGEAGPDSDVDVLAIVRDLTGTERREIYEIGAEVYMETRVHVAPLAMSELEYAELERLERLLPNEIARDGIAL
jgi:predicted nucleotidyltransferase